MASNAKKTKVKRAQRHAKMVKSKKKEMSKPGKYKRLPLED